MHRVEAQHTTLKKIHGCLPSPHRQKTEHINGTPRTSIRLIESHQGFFWLHPNSVRLHFNVHKHGIQRTDQNSRWRTSTGGQLLWTWENNLEYTRSPASGNPTHKQLLHIWQQTLPPNCRSLHGRDPITRNMWHMAIPNPGTAVPNLTTQEQNQHACPFQRWWVHDMGEAPAHNVADFFQTENNLHNLLRSTRTTSPQEITFLDTSV